VFPVHTARTVLEQEGFYGDAIHQQSPQALASLFADAAVRHHQPLGCAVCIDYYRMVTVNFDYRLVSKDYLW
jgi:hypothetical protein